MFRIIQNLRNKSETYRRSVALVTSVVATLAIFFVWASINFPSAVSGPAVLAKKATDEQGPIATFGRNTALSFGAVKDQLNSLAKYFSETKYESDEGEIEIIPSNFSSTRNSPEAANPARNKAR